jgi:hypothetical protein
MVQRTPKHGGDRIKQFWFELSLSLGEMYRRVSEHVHASVPAPLLKFVLSRKRRGADNAS